MLKTSLFVVFSALLLGLCLMVSGPDPQSDAFADLAPGQFLSLDGVAIDEIAALKLRHLRAIPAVDVLLLGNSRPLPIAAEDLGVPVEHFFNGALSGESLRSSVLLLEQLAAMGKLPKLALISFDNAELQYYSNPLWPRAVPRWRALRDDIVAGLRRPDITRADLARMISRHVSTEAHILAQSLSFARVWRGVTVLAGQAYAPLSVAGGYGGDGSRATAPVLHPYVPAPLIPANRNVLPGYLDYDLERLAALGTRVVIFETFLHPGQIHQFHPQNPVALETRAALLSLCTRHGLECHTAPDMAETAQPWPDIGHPPAAMLAPYLRGLMDKAVVQR